VWEQSRASNLRRLLRPRRPHSENFTAACEQFRPLRCSTTT
jgi:hypothetical protein